MYLGAWEIDDYLPIPVTTHRFSTGAAYAPTSLTYSIYEDATATGLYEDVDMVVASPFDSVTGMYLARVQLTAAAGFEAGKNYTVLVKATVDGVSGIVAHTFQVGVIADTWAYSSRTLTQSAASVASAVSGSDITATRGDTLSAALTDVGALTNYSKIWFTVKGDEADADTASLVQIELTDGLKYINGATATTAANGSITINDEATGDVTILLKAPETAKLSPGTYRYDIQILRSTGILVSTLSSGIFIVSADYTRAVA